MGNLWVLLAGICFLMLALEAYEWFVDPSPIKVYVARAMTGRIKEEVVFEAKRDKSILESAGFIVLDPVTSEGVKPTKTVLRSTKAQMDVFWTRDKAMIREANVLLNMSPHLPSLGVIREHGYARYHLWKKTISIFPEGAMPKEGAVCFYEDDHVTDDLTEAIGECLRTHATRWKRFKWRLALYNRCYLRSLKHRTMEWFR